MYAVRVGRKPGMYNTWEECKEQVDKYPNAQFKKVKTIEEYNKFMSDEEGVIEDSYGCYIGVYSKDDQYGYSIVCISEKGIYQQYGKVIGRWKYSVKACEMYAVIEAFSLLSKEGIELPIFVKFVDLKNYVEGSWKPKGMMQIKFKEIMDSLSYEWGIKPEVKLVKSVKDTTYYKMAEMLAESGARVDIKIIGDVSCLR